MPTNRHPLEQQQGDLEYSGLEVALSTAPELVPLAPGESAPECLYPGPVDTHDKIYVSPPEYNPKDEGGSGQNAAFQPWWKRKRFNILFIIAGVIVIIGLAVGLGVGLSTRNKASTNTDVSNNGITTNNGSQNDSNAVAPSCAGGLCPQILSMTEHESALYVFARTTENQLTACTLNGTSWNKDFITVGKPGGSLISQPKAVSWIVHNKIPRLDVFVVTNSKTDMEYWSTFYTKAEGWYKWESQGANAGSPPSICFLDPLDPYSRLDFWGTRHNNGSITNTEWYQRWDNETEEAVEEGRTRQIGWLFNAGTVWGTAKDISLPLASSSIGLVCNGNELRDLLWYDKNNGSLLHTSLNEGWNGYQSLGGDFIGELAVFRWINLKRWDFFGVQANHEVYHMSYTSGDSRTYSALRSLGGNITSSPSVVSVKEGVMDIVALGSDGYLQHLHYDGSNWSADWENLGVAVQSAPSMLIFKDDVYITAVANDGGLISIKRPGKAVSSTWNNDLQREDLGGSLSLEYMIYD